MDIQAEKISLAQLLLQTEDVTIIKKVKAIFKKEQKDWWDELTEEQKEAINEGLKDADEGRVVPFESFMQKYL
jgi:predicted transcriptional regulator